VLESVDTATTLAPSPSVPVRAAAGSVAIELPEGRLTTAKIAEHFGVSEEWIFTWGGGVIECGGEDGA
jgi:hypothetical protein